MRYTKAIPQIIHSIRARTPSNCRKVSVVNLDPANEGMPYPCALDVTDLVSLTDVMEEYGLGPNGGVIFCMEYLLKNMSWLLEGLDKLKGQLVG